MKNSRYILLWFLLAVCGQSCSIIDDDLTNCGQNYMLNYEMRLETNMQTEISTVLNAESDEMVVEALKKKLSPIFSDHAHDVDLSFYSYSEADLKHHLFEVIDSNKSSFTFYLPKEEYMHLAVANLQENTVATLYGAEYSNTAHVKQSAGDTINSQETGVFSARMPMQVVDTIDQVFDVTLYMINSAVALVIDTTGYSGHVIEAYTEGTASAFFVKDSIYLFASPSLIRGEEVIVDEVAQGVPGMKRVGGKKHSPQACFTTVNLPSRDEADADGVYWRMKAYVRLADGTITENLLTVKEPLRAGQLKVLKMQLQENGKLVPVVSTNIGVSVTLDWKQGNEYEPWLGVAGRK